MPVDLAAAAAFTYVGLPVGSGGAHGLGRMGMDKADAVTEKFIAACATVTDRTEPRVKLRQVPELDIPESITTAVRDVFGDPGGGRTSAERGIEFLKQIAPQPTNAWGMAPVRFLSAATVQLNDPATGAPIPGQDPSAFNGVEYEWSVPLGRSQVRLMRDNRASLPVGAVHPELRPRSAAPGRAPAAGEPALPVECEALARVVPHEDRIVPREKDARSVDVRLSQRTPRSSGTKRVRPMNALSAGARRWRRCPGGR